MSHFLNILIISLINSGLFDYKVGRIKNEETDNYINGEITKKVVNSWNPATEDPLAYPGGDKEKMSKIASLWSEYYRCLSRVKASLTGARRMPSSSQMAHDGSAVRLACDLCLSPEDKGSLVWMYTKSLADPTLIPMEHKETAVQEQDGNLTIYHATAADSGVYRCRAGGSVGGPVVLEVVDMEPYRVVRPYSAKGSHVKSSMTSDGLELFTAWQRWTECSKCDQIGRRIMHGFCFVTIHNQSIEKNKNESHTAETSIAENTRKIFEAFPRGLPCRSKYLPKHIRNMNVVKQRKSEIIIDLCKERCKNNVMFEVYSTNGTLLERVNNSADVYSSHQQSPPQPPLPVNEIIFAVKGTCLHIKCPGTTLSDMPVTWRIGTKEVVEREDQESEDRIMVNARDHLMINSVVSSDDNLYSCWQRERLAGSVKVTVWEGESAQRQRHLLTVAVLVAVVLLLRLLHTFGLFY